MVRDLSLRVLCVAVLVLAPGAQRAAAEPLAFVGATVIDGRGGAPIELGTVVVRGERNRGRRPRRRRSPCPRTRG